MIGILLSIVIGCLAGFCAGKLMKGGWIFDLLGVQWGGLLGQLGTAIIGAVVILYVASLLKK